MGRQDELCCPICQADILLGDEKLGDEVYCGYCGAPSLIVAKKDDQEDWDLEEDL